MKNRWLSFSVVSALLVLTQGANALACGGTEITGMRKLANGTIEISFSQTPEWGGQAKPYVLSDDDGAATITILHYLNIHDLALSHDIEKKWPELKKTEVPNWPKMKTLVLEQLNRLSAFYKNLAEKTSDPEAKGIAQRRAEEAEKTKAALDHPKLTYEQYNALGRFLDKESRMHTYDLSGKKGVKLIENNTNNPIGSALIDVNFELPPDLISMCASPFKGDVGKLASSALAQTGESSSAGSNGNGAGGAR